MWQVLKVEVEHRPSKSVHSAGHLVVENRAKAQGGCTKCRSTCVRLCAEGKDFLSGYLHSGYYFHFLIRESEMEASS